jgi:hypothetical protein
VSYYFSIHAQDRLDTDLCSFVTPEEVLNEIITKKEHSANGSHWVLIKDLPMIYRLPRRKGKTAVGDRIVAIVREQTIVTVMLREKTEALPTNCHFFWD